MLTRKKRKIRTKEEIEKEIIDYVKNLEFPTTSAEIARAIKLNWFTSKIYLDKLKKEGKIHLKKVGRQNQWWLENMSKQKKLAEKSVKLEKENLELKEEVKEVRGEIKEVKDENLKLKEDNLKFEKAIQEMEIRIHELES